jgi:hypothetical protein
MCTRTRVQTPVTFTRSPAQVERAASKFAVLVASRLSPSRIRIAKRRRSQLGVTGRTLRSDAIVITVS